MKQFLLAFAIVIFAQLKAFSQPADNTLATGLDYNNCTGMGSVVPLGHASVNPTGHYPPFAVRWSTGDTAFLVDSLPEGNYIVTVTDSFGNQVTDSFNIHPMRWQAVELLKRQCFDGDYALVHIKVPNADEIYVSGGYLGNLYWDSCQCADDTFVIYEPFDQLNIDCRNYHIAYNTYNTCFLDTVLGPMHAGFLVQTQTLSSVLCLEPANKIKASPYFLSPAYTFIPGEHFTYHWNTGGAFDTISGVPPSTYTVTVSNNLGCSVTDSITFAATDSITLLDTLIKQPCYSEDNGLITLIAASTRGGITYSWGWLMDGPTDSALTGGIYHCLITDGGGCYEHVYINLEETPPVTYDILTVPSVCNYATGALQIQNIQGGTPPYTVYWDSHDTTLYYFNQPAGWHSIDIIDAHNCQYYFNKYLDCVTGLADAGEDDLQLYPNPANNVLYINCTDIRPVEISVYNATGSVLLNEPFKNEISLTELPNGLYLLMLKTGSGNITRRFVKSN